MNAGNGKNDALPKAGTSTVFLLFARFNRETIPMVEIAENYLGMKEKYAREKFNRGEFPIPAFRTYDSPNAPIMVRIQDLATYLDEQATKARAAWGKAAI